MRVTVREKSGVSKDWVFTFERESGGTKVAAGEGKLAGGGADSDVGVGSKRKRDDAGDGEGGGSA